MWSPSYRGGGTPWGEPYAGFFCYATWSARAIAPPRVMQPLPRSPLPNEPAMRFAMRVLANLTDGRKGDAQDRLRYALERLAPAA